MRTDSILGYKDLKKNLKYEWLRKKNKSNPDKTNPNLFLLTCPN